MTSEKNPSEPNSLEILEALWKALQDHYPMMEYMGSSGNAWLEEYRPKVAAASTSEAAYLQMDELVCRFNDYHTRFFWPGQPARSSPPIRVEPVLTRSWKSDSRRIEAWAGGTNAFHPFVSPPSELPSLTGFAVAVVQAAPDSGVQRGDEIVRVDGVPVEEALRQAWKHSVGSSFAGKLRGSVWRMLLGDRETPIELGIRSPSSRTVKTVELLRSGGIEDPTVDAQERDGIPVIRITRWWNRDGENLVAQADDRLEKYRHSRGIIFDVRVNGGGDDSLADQVTGRFLAHPVISSISFHRLVPELTYRRSVEWAQPRGPWRFEGRVAVLTDEGCMSACEHFVSGMVEAGALLSGTPTSGACGWIRPVELPGGARVNVSQTFPLHTGGIPSPLLGMAPHVWRPRTLADLQAGRDAALDAALDWIHSDAPLPGRKQPL